MPDDRSDQLPDKEIERRMQKAIQRALKTPPKPFTPSTKGKGDKKPTRKRKPAK